MSGFLVFQLTGFEEFLIGTKEFMINEKGQPYTG